MAADSFQLTFAAFKEAQKDTIDGMIRSPQAGMGRVGHWNPNDPVVSWIKDGAYWFEVTCTDIPTLDRLAVLFMHVMRHGIWVLGSRALRIQYAKLSYQQEIARFYLTFVWRLDDVVAP